MKYELKGIKYAAFASEETACYQAGIYRDGRKVGEVSNDGHGGCNIIHFIDGNQGAESSLFKKHCIEWYEAQPSSHTGIAAELDGRYREMSAMESWCGHQLDQYLNARELKRLVKQSVKKGPFYRFEGDDDGTWRGIKVPAPTMSLSMMRIVVEKWNAKDGGKRVLSGFINGGQHIKV